MSRASAAENSATPANAASNAGAPSLNVHPSQNDVQATASTDLLRPFQPVAHAALQPAASQPVAPHPYESSPPTSVARLDQERLDKARLDQAEAKPRPHFAIFHDPHDWSESGDSHARRPSGAEDEPDGGSGLRGRSSAKTRSEWPPAS